MRATATPIMWRATTPTGASTSGSVRPGSGPPSRPSVIAAALIWMVDIKIKAAAITEGRDGGPDPGRTEPEVDAPVGVVARHIIGVAVARIAQIPLTRDHD